MLYGFESMKTQATKTPRQKTTANMVQKIGPLSILRNPSAMSTTTSVDNSQAIASEIQPKTPYRSNASQTQLTDLPTTSAPHLQASQLSIVFYVQEEQTPFNLVI